MNNVSVPGSHLAWTGDTPVYCPNIQHPSQSGEVHQERTAHHKRSQIKGVGYVVYTAVLLKIVMLCFEVDLDSS